MSDLAIEWGDDQLVVLQGKVSGKHVNAKRAAVLKWPEEIDPTKDPKQAAEWLKGELGSKGFTSKSALVSLPRETVVVRHLELPNVPDGELPNMVKLQAATKVTMAADQYLLDYIPLPPRGAETRDVLMTTVPTEVTGIIRKVLGDCGIELGSVGVSSFHSGEMVSHQQDAKTRAANQLHLSVVLAGSRVELALLRGKCALATSSTRIDREGEAKHKAINAEINRLRLSAQDLHGGLPISHVWVTPSDADSAALCEFLKDKLNCEGTCYDPLGGSGDVAVDDRGYFNAVAGHMLGSGNSLTESVNYLDPRKPVLKKDNRKVKMALAAAGVVAVLGAGYWMIQKKVADQNAQTMAVNEEINKIKATVDRGKNDMDSAELVDEWVGKRSDWLDQMVELQDLLPKSDRLLVEKFNFRPGKKEEKSAFAISGIAKTRAEVENFTDVLQKRGYQPGTPKFESSNRDEDYEIEFSLTVTRPVGSAETTIAKK